MIYLCDLMLGSTFSLWTKIITLVLVNFSFKLSICASMQVLLHCAGLSDPTLHW